MHRLPPAPAATAGRERGRPADRLLVIALSLYLAAVGVVLLLFPPPARGVLAVMLGAAAALVAFAVPTAYRPAPPGARDEPRTARTLRPMQPSGWRVVDRIPFATIDIDHVAFGPEGIVAIEDVYLAWPGPVTEHDLDVLDDARRRARRAARRLRLVLKSDGIDARVAPALAVWGSGGRYIAEGLLGGVAAVVGRDEGRWGEQLPTTGERWSDEELDDIEHALRRFAEAHDRAYARRASVHTLRA